MVATECIKRFQISDALARIIPFAGFMIFIGFEEGLRFLRSHGLVSFSDQNLYLLYPVKTLTTVFLLFWLYRRFIELNWRDLGRISDTLQSLLLGLVVFVLWINMDWSFGAPDKGAGFNPGLFSNVALFNTLIFFRLAGAVLVVPLMEELFWRSFLLRYLVDNEFMKIRVGQFTWFSCLVSAVLFGLEHHLIFAGIMAGLAYNFLLYRTKSIVQCIFAHAVTNLALGVYVLVSGRWIFW
jgi:CAAX prenyl protease-like protein